MQGIEYHIPEPDYYHKNTQPKQYQKQQNQNVYLPPLPSIEDIRTWYGRGRGRARCFGILHQWYTLWQELRQLQCTGQ